MPTITTRLLPAAALVAALGASAAPAAAHVDIRFDPVEQTALKGSVVSVDLVLESGTAGPEAFDALDAIVQWDPTRLKLLGTNGANADVAWILAGLLPNDPDGANAVIADGDAIFTALAPPGAGTTAPAGPDPLVVTTFEFLALEPTAGTTVSLLPTIGTFGTTRVLSFGTNVTGDTSGTATVKILDTVDVNVKVELEGVWASVGPLLLDRCITFELHEAGGTTTVLDATLDFFSSAPNTNATAEATFTVAALPYDCMTARDRLHTLRRTDSDDFGPVSGGFAADFTDRSGSGGDNDALPGGDLNDDGVIDGDDVVIWSNLNPTNYGTGDTDCATVGPHADVSGDGLVDSKDFTGFIIPNLGETDEPGCAFPPSTVPDVTTAKPRLLRPTTNVVPARGAGSLDAMAGGQ